MTTRLLSSLTKHYLKIHKNIDIKLIIYVLQLYCLEIRTLIQIKMFGQAMSFDVFFEKSNKMTVSKDWLGFSFDLHQLARFFLWCHGDLSLFLWDKDLLIQSYKIDFCRRMFEIKQDFAHRSLRNELVYMFILHFSPVSQTFIQNNDFLFK